MFYVCYRFRCLSQYFDFFYFLISIWQDNRNRMAIISAKYQHICFEIQYRMGAAIWPATMLILHYHSLRLLNLDYGYCHIHVCFYKNYQFWYHIRIITTPLLKKSLSITEKGS